MLTRPIEENALSKTLIMPWGLCFMVSFAFERFQTVYRVPVVSGVLLAVTSHSLGGRPLLAST
jgi:hypothetical protein